MSTKRKLRDLSAQVERLTETLDNMLAAESERFFVRLRGQGVTSYSGTMEEWAIILSFLQALDFEGLDHGISVSEGTPKGGLE